MQPQLQSILQTLQDKFALSEAEVLDCLEQTFAQVLTYRYKNPVTVYFNETTGALDIFSYVQVGGVAREYRIAPEKIRGLNTIHRHIERNLQRKVVEREYGFAKRLEGKLVWGEIVRFADDRTLHVQIDVNGLEPMLSFCELRYQPPHERKAYLLGDRRAFRVRRVEMTTQKESGEADGEVAGDTLMPMIRITLDRTSLNIVELLLRAKLAEVQPDRRVRIRCNKRIAGGRADVTVSDLIPRVVIKFVADELKERIFVQKEEPLPGSEGAAPAPAYDPLGSAATAAPPSYNPLGD